MTRYTEWNGSQVDYDLDSTDTFKEDRTERLYQNRSNQTREWLEDYDGDWDDMDCE